MRDVFELIERVAPTDANVLLLGENGVGKEVMANDIHRLSHRSGGPLVKLNCAAFPPNMIEGELFGYLKGAFTGAVADFPGMIAEADGGTLFLDEIAEMPAELQTRFLRVLQRFAAQLGKEEPVVSPEAYDLLLNYGWPGNVRELQNAIEYSVVLADHALITPKQLPRELHLPVALQAAKSAPAAPTLKLDEQEKNTILQALAQTHGNKKRAAAVLGIHRPTLYSKMKRYGIALT
jgi:transcriptional regulator with PAS, ATPase and Fis domain